MEVNTLYELFGKQFVIILILLKAIWNADDPCTINMVYRLFIFDNEKRFYKIVSRTKEKAKYIFLVLATE